MEISYKTQKLSCDFTSRSRGYHAADGAGKLSRRKGCSRTAMGGARRRCRCDGLSGVATPFVQWKFNGDGARAPVTGGGRIRRMNGGGDVAVSARKLAAGMWHLAAVLNSGGGNGGDDSNGMTWHSQHRRFDRLHFALQSSFPISKSATEGAAKWDDACPNAPTPIEVSQFNSNVKLLRSQQFAAISKVSALQVELVRARRRIKELELERHSIKKKLKHFVKGIRKEKASWMRREHHKMFLMIDELKGEVESEKRNNQKMDIVNSKLLSDLADAKLSVKQLMQNYEREKNSKELLEDVCHKLGNDIEDHKANIKSMKIECAKILEEVEEERKMMQMAEVWREERVQMKLVDAKLILEEKYCQMNNLIADLEILLTYNDAHSEVINTSEAKGVNLAMDSFSIEDIKEQCCTPSMVNDMQTIIKNLDHNVSPEANEIARKCVYMHPESSIDHDQISGNAGLRETVTCLKDQYSSYTLGDRACAVDGINGSRYISSATIGNNRNANNQECMTNKINSAEKLKNKGPSLSELWRSSPSAAGVRSTISIEENGRLSNGSNTSNLAFSPEKMSEEALDHNELFGHWCLPGRRNPHVARAMRGCMLRPRGIQRYGSKGKLLEASFESQKSQLRNALKRSKIRSHTP